MTRRPEPGETLVSLPTGLTNREHEALRLLARGMSNREIAAEMYIGEATAKSHRGPSAHESRRA